MDDPEPLLRQGHRAFKIHAERFGAGSSPQGLVDLVRRLRDVVGAECTLMVDAFMRWDVPTTLEMADALAPLGIAWIEEPLPPDDLAGYAEVAPRSPVPIAGGEHEYTALGFKELIERRLHHVLQPDACWCGGLTQLAEIYALAKRAGLRVCPHRGAEVWGLHAIAALDPQPLAESGRRWMTWLLGQPRIENGTVTLTGEPGFGVVPNGSALRQLSRT